MNRCCLNRALDPEAVLKLVDKPGVHAPGKEVPKLLQRVCASLKT
jgi:hypothetical protein